MFPAMMVKHNKYTTAVSRGVSLVETQDIYGIGPLMSGRAKTLLEQSCPGSAVCDMKMNVQLREHCDKTHAVPVCNNVSCSMTVVGENGWEG